MRRVVFWIERRVLMLISAANIFVAAIVMRVSSGFISRLTICAFHTFFTSLRIFVVPFSLGFCLCKPKIFLLPRCFPIFVSWWLNKLVAWSTFLCEPSGGGAIRYSRNELETESPLEFAPQERLKSFHSDRGAAMRKCLRCQMLHRREWREISV